MHNGRKVSATVAYLLFFAALAILLSLGGWQWRRGIEKTTVEAQLARADSITLARAPGDWNSVAWRRARLQGAWVAGADFLLANRIHRGRAGYEVFSAFRLAGDGATLLINRGWVAADAADSSVGVAAAAGATVSGRLYLPQKGFTLGPAHDPAAARPGAPKVFQYFDPAAMSAVFGGELQPAALALDAAHPAAFTVIWQPSTVPAARHYGYAVQWWGLAATLVVFGIVWYRRGRRQRRGEEPSPASSSPSPPSPSRR